MDRALGVSELIGRVNDALGSLGLVTVRGVVESAKASQRGHLYFDLIDDGDRQARVSAAIWASRRAGIETALRRAGLGSLGDGALVVVSGRLQVYAPRGSMSLSIDRVEIEAMLDARAATRQRHLRQLAAEGIVDANRRVPVPAVALRIALVASRDGVVREDVRRALADTGFAFTVRLYHTEVSTRAASVQIRRALAAAIADQPDLVLVARGGGSEGDLAAFDDLDLARAVATAPVPIWVAIGHAVDQPLLAYVANCAFDVPQSAAKALVARVEDFREGLATEIATAIHHARARLDRGWLHTRQIAHAIEAHSQRRLAAAHRSLPSPSVLDARTDQRLTNERHTLPATSVIDARVRARLARSRAVLTAARSARDIVRLRVRLEVRQLVDHRRELAAATSAIATAHRTELHARQRRLTRAAARRRAHHDAALAAVRRHLTAASYRRARRDRRGLELLARRIEGLASPLERGFAMITDPTGTWLRRADAIATHAIVHAHFVDGVAALTPARRSPTTTHPHLTTRQGGRPNDD
ncbi:Exodeoxyribonuclease VII [Acidimicrobium ferrooxidans DSM 10331]|uniref:Exodeoxyribonuclease 7 large subunit n=1 Tax=Acidimicrobium ferrooxidans (strain DSM 10331 / JCM 15462 / NBRC 103882 / ICP) TaxID=525909 RepID=C7LZG2_ACIFD|nr:exodeoxyribonuclease VII large subunit [Acidimicrobium ferrooxidans]ACU54120.1 Exodeoxyribonuclease VII [Acidimicrobium ferrooxidans DSM 10331]